MKNFGIKLKLILFPYLILSVLFIALYTFFDWWLLMRTGVVFSMREMIPYGIIPFFILWIPLWFGLRRRTKLLKHPRDGGWFSMLIIMSIAIAGTNGITQGYVEAATGKITHLDNINEIHQKPPTRYYTLKNYYVDTSNVHVYNRSFTSGKNAQHYDMEAYMAFPILTKKEDTTSSYKYWIGQKNTEEIDNTVLSDEGRANAMQQFKEERAAVFHQTDFNRFTYLSRIGVSEELDIFSDVIQQKDITTTPETTVLKAIDASFALRTGDLMQYILGVYGFGLFFLLLILIFTKLDMEALSAFQDRREKDRWKHRS